MECNVGVHVLKSNTKHSFEKKHTFYMQLSFTLLCPILINDLTGVYPRV